MTADELAQKTDEELAAEYGVGPDDARFIAALEAGVIDGDVVVVDEAPPAIDPAVARRLGLKAPKAD